MTASASPVVLEVAYRNLEVLGQRVAEETSLPMWFASQIDPLVQRFQLIAALRKEQEQFPLFSDVLQAQFALATIRSSLPSVESAQSPSLIAMHFAPGGTVLLENRPLQPSWTLECWLQLAGSSPVILLQGSAGKLQVGAHSLSFESETEAITIPVSISVGVWTHVAVRVDSATSVCLFASLNVGMLRLHRRKSDGFQNLLFFSLPHDAREPAEFLRVRCV